MPITIDPKSWAGASERDKMLARSGKDVMTARAKEVADAFTMEQVLEITGLKAFSEQVSQHPETYFSGLLNISGAVIDFLLTKVTGLNIPDGAIAGAISGSTSEEVRRQFGSILLQFLDDNLDVGKVAAGFQSRNPGEGERDSMARLLGTAFRIQVGDMAADWATQALPFGLASGLKNVAERFNDAMNLDDALEDIIQVPMQEVIEKGMQQYYARTIKPEDFTESEVRNAFLQGYIDEALYNKVLDNHGVRDDIRDPLLQMAAPNLTESDINDLYQHNLLDRVQVKDQYKNKGFQEEEREFKTKLVEGTRRWKLEEKLFEQLGNLYRDGVATREECRPHLDHFGYDPDEQDMWFQIQELERKQRKWISDSNLIKLILSGEKTTTDAIAYLTMQGMEVNDAASLVTLGVKAEKHAEAKAIEAQAKAAIAKLPKAVKDQCDDLFNPKAILQKLLPKIVALIPTDPTGFADLVDVMQLIQCALGQLNNPPPPTP